MTLVLFPALGGIRAYADAVGCAKPYTGQTEVGIYTISTAAQLEKLR